MIHQFEIPIALGQMAQIYALVDPRTLEIRYVGKAFDPQERLNGHMRDSVLARYKCKRTSWLKSLKTLGLMPSIVILECVPESEWAECEMKWIAHFRSVGTNLTNTQDGGEGQSKGFKPSAESVERTASKLRGKRRPPYVGEKISAALRGRKASVESIAKFHGGLRKWWSEMTPEAKQAKLAKVHAGSRKDAIARNAHGQLGVSWMEDRKKWQTYINFQGKRIRLGNFSDFEAAVAARKAAEQRLFGEFAHAA